MRSRSLIGGVVLGMLLVALAPLPAALAAPPVFSKVFAPDTIGPGSETTLTFVIDNTAEASPADELTFSDTLPAGVVIATPPNASTTCLADAGGDGPDVTAGGGGMTISLANASVGAGATCTVTVDVTSTSSGTHTNTSGELTSSLGSSGAATDDLTVDVSLPGFAKDFSPDPIDKGERSTLTFTIDNSAPGSPVHSLDFTDTLPTGLVVADPANASTDCVNSFGTTTIVADPGTAFISLDADGFSGFPVLGSNSTCQLDVEVVATGAGTLLNSSGELFRTIGTSTVSTGKATATIDVLVFALHLTKEFMDDPVAPADTATIEFTIENFDRDFPATGVSFTDTLPAGVVVATTPNTTNSCSGTLLAAGSTISLSGGTVPAESSCTVTVDVTAASAGTYTNTTTSVTGTVDGSPVTGNAATDKLFVVPAPKLTKSFTDDPVTGGDVVTASFTITNTDPTGAATDITFFDDFPSILRTSPSGAPADGFCGGSSTATFTPLSDPASSTPTPARLSVSGASLAAAGTPGDSCTFSITLDVDPTAATGEHPNVTSEISATVGSMTVTGPPATDNLVVVEAPNLSKEFTDDPIAPGGSATLEFTLTHDADSPGEATGIGFTDDLSIVAAGLTLGSVDSNGCGGSVTGLGTTTITFSGGGPLAAGSSCTIVVTVDSTTSTPQGTHTNQTGAVSATVLGQAVTNVGGLDELLVVDLSLAKSFTDDPTLPGGTVTLEFVITNTSATEDATGIFFSDDLDDVISGLAPAGPLPGTPCGGSSFLTFGGGTLSLFGGEVPASSSCTFSVTLDVPAAAAPALYENATTEMLATISGQSATLPGAEDLLEVAPLPTVDLTKEFTDDPILPGDSVTLQFDLVNTSATHAVDSISFTDALGAVATGLTLGSVDFNDCGGAVSGIGTGSLTFSGGSLAAAGSCTIVVTVDSTAATPAGTHTNTTSTVSAASPATTEPLSGAAASDDLIVSADPLVLTKRFTNDPVEAGATATLRFQIFNIGGTTVSSIGFTDDLAAALSGLKGTGLPIGPVCGGGTLSGSAGDTFLTFAGGSLGPNTSCTITVTVQVPATAAAGTYTNTTSTVTGDDGGPVSGAAASDDLTVVEPARSADLSITKVDTPDPVVPGEALVYTIEVSNAGPDTVVAASVTDTLPAGVTFVSTSGCAGSPGGGVPTCSLGRIAAGASKSYTINVDVDPDATGSITNTAAVSALILDPDTSNNSASAATALAPVADVSVTKSDGVPSAVPGESITYTIVAANAGPSTDPAVSLADTFPAELTCTWTSAAAGGATGNTAAGSGDLAETLSLPPGSSATYTVDCAIDPSATGTVSNTATVAASVPDPDTGNDSATDDTDLTPEADMEITKADSLDPVVAGTQLTYTITVENLGPSDATDVTVGDLLPPDATYVSDTDGCIEDPAGVLTCDLDTVAAGASVSFDVVVDVDPGAAGPLDNRASVGSGVTEPDSSNNVVNELTTVVYEADLGITKVDDADPAIPGGTVTYTIGVTNAGPSDATGVTVVDTVPAGLTYVSDTDACTPGVPGPGFVTCVLTTIDAGAAASFDITFDIDPAATGGLTNEATVSSDATDPVSGNDTATEDTALAPEADLTIAKADDVDPAVAGNAVTYTFTVDNLGPSDATGVTVVDDVPAGLMFDSATAPCTPGAPGPGQLTCDVGDVAAGGSSSFDVSFFIDPATPPGTLTNQATVASSTPDPVAANDATTEDTEIVAEADLVIFKVGDPTVAAGDSVTYSFSVENLGPSDATNVTVVDDVPTGLMFDSSTVPCTPGDPGPGFVTCDLGDIAAGADSGVFSLTFLVDPAAPPGTVTNEVTVSSDAAEVDPSDNSDTEDTEIVAEADLAIAKVDVDDPVLAGETVTYEIVVENFGPSDATGVTVVDDVPAGLMFASADVPCVPGPPGTLTCDLGTLPAGFGITFEVTFDVDPAAPAGSVVNEVTVSSDAADSDPGDNTASETTEIDVAADLDIEKEAERSEARPGDTLTYDIDIFNFGPSDATGVTVVDTLPPGTTYVSDTGGCVEASPGTLTCDLGTIPVFGSEAFEVTVEVDPGATGTLTNTATVSSDAADPDTSDNTVTATTAVATEADLAITKTDSPDPVRLGQLVTYRVTVANAGPSDATGVVVTDRLPAGVVQARTSGCAEDDRGVPTCTLGTIAAGASKSYTITARVTGSTTRVLVNTASVSATTFDPDSSNNSATARTTTSRPQQPEVGLFDPVTGRWTQLLRNGSTRTFTYGNPGDYGIVGDWDGDGDRTPGVLRTLNGDTGFFVRNSNSSGPADFVFVVGEPGDIPVAGDWSGNGRESLALFRPSTAMWYVFSDFADVVPDVVFLFGNPGDAPSAVDIDGDGDADPVAYRDMGALGGHVFVRRSLTTGPADGVFIFGNPGDAVLFGDYDYDGAATVGTFRPGDATFYLRNANTTGIANLTIPLGLGRELPVAGPWFP